MEAQRQAEVADLKQQLQSAQQRFADRQEQHQQGLEEQVAAATAAAALEHQHELARLRQQFAQCLKEHTTAVAHLQQDVVEATTQAETDMATVSQRLTDVQSESSNHQSALKQQLQQLAREVAELQQGSICSDKQEPESQLSVQEALQQLIDMQEQLASQGCSGLAGLLEKYEKVKAQVCH